MDILPHIPVYAALAIYLAAFFFMRTRHEKAGTHLFTAGFCLALAAVAMHAAVVRRIPMRGMYEVFLVMGMLVYPVARLCARVSGRKLAAADSMLGALMLCPVIFAFDPAPATLPPALRHWLFAPHVLAYLLGYLVMFKAGTLSMRVLLQDGASPDSLQQRDRQIRSLLRLGFPLLTIGLALGALWGKLAWGDYWNWDPKEMWALATWLVFAAALHETGGNRPKRAAALTLLGYAVILCTLIWVNLAGTFSGLHSYAG